VGRNWPGSDPDVTGEGSLTAWLAGTTFDRGSGFREDRTLKECLVTLILFGEPSLDIEHVLSE